MEDFTGRVSCTYFIREEDNIEEDFVFEDIKFQEDKEFLTLGALLHIRGKLNRYKDKDGIICNTISKF